MTIGYQAILRIRRVEEKANKLGFRFSHCKYGSRELDVIALYPKDDAMPDFHRDSELFVGDLANVESFLRGIEFTSTYYKMIKAVTDKKILHQEDLVRQRQLIDKLKGDEPKAI